jgi:non-specific serine/threonine protein kinase
MARRTPKTQDGILQTTNGSDSHQLLVGTAVAMSLPHDLTSFVGRERDIARIVQLFERTRLVTLTGPGGVGKTRLALRAATLLQSGFRDGILFVSLASIADPGLVAATIAQAAEVKEVTGQSILDALKAALRAKALLLVLDNFEHVASAAPLVVELLASGPRLKVLVTSREVLRLSGEHELPVVPLTLPDPNRIASAATVGVAEAVTLFVARAQAVRQDFTLTDQNAPAVSELCQRLDGLPLAIELAAARLRSLPLPMLLGRLERPLPLLTGGPRDAPARQQTLRATIAWSHNLLEPAEQVLFRRLAILRGATFDAIEAICFPSGAGPGAASLTLPAIAADTLASITSLVEKNLLIQSELPDGQPWFTMLETIREFALERLAASGEADTVFRRYVLYYLTLVEAAEQEWQGARHATWIARLQQEHDNLRLALRWCVERGYAEPAFRMAAVLWWFWAVHGHITEGRERLGTILARFPVRGARNKLIGWRAWALRNAGLLASIQGDHAAARALQEEGLALRRQLGDLAGIYSALEGLGVIANQQGDHAAARAAFEEALSLAPLSANPEVVAGTIHNLGSVLHAQGDNTRARELLEQALTLYRTIADPHYISTALFTLVKVAQDLADYDLARKLAEEMLDLCPLHGDRRTEGLALATLGDITTVQGDYVAANNYLRAGLTIGRELGDPARIASILDSFAQLAAAQLAAARAVRLAGGAAALRTRIGIRLAPAAQARVDQMLEPVRKSLGKRASDEAWKAGEALSLDDAVAEALAPLEPSPATDANGSRPNVLTRRETEVIALIGQGYTNRQIADALVITEGTAANHVVHILAKLGYHSRSQLAVWAAENGLLASPKNEQ